MLAEKPPVRTVLPWDGPLRYKVRSRTRDKTYFVQIDAYGWQGACSCEHFRFKLEKVLALGISPEAAVEQGAVELKDWQRSPCNALRCFHVLEARDQFLEDFGQEVDRRKKENGIHER